MTKAQARAMLLMVVIGFTCACGWLAICDAQGWDSMALLGLAAGLVVAVAVIWKGVGGGPP